MFFGFFVDMCLNIFIMVIGIIEIIVVIIIMWSSNVINVV